MSPLILTTDEGKALRMFEGNTVIPLDAESANYREWLVTIGAVQYCLIDDHDTWTLLRYARGTAQWVATTTCVDTFLRRHRLILAA